MRLSLLTMLVVVAPHSSAGAATIEGEYLEARSCNVYTGPCFANGEMELAGKEALLAWKVEKGTWNDVDLAGRGVALVVSSETTLGSDGVFPMKPGKVESVVLVDENATAEQKQALVAFAKDSAGKLAADVKEIQSVPFTLENDHLSSRGQFQAGEIAKIQTRKLKKGDCVCSNEIVFYQPLVKVENAHPAFSLDHTFKGKGLQKSWSGGGERGAFLGTFRK
ncbi:DUF1326 domain-containing protein [Thalassoroseus pseudoceratinae]|uniref:DUF1326 domain-containing protein n=1 Tax=Thalassoroseus pseudoceratinae TaxID=2713176 RepID=UPI001421B62B|nr:DUF1326 domain-containing protein [Thalassoroseus pseudoceratinae]